MSNFERGKDPKEAMGIGIEAEMRKWLKDNYESVFGDPNKNIDDSVNLILKYCADEGKLDFVRYLVEKKGADIHTDNENPLRWACKNGHLDVVKYLVERGADIHIFNNLARRWAEENGHTAVVNYINDKIKKQRKDFKVVREDL